MKENLRTTHYADETEIPVGSTTSITEFYRYAPNYDDSIVPLYGYLYNWAAVMHGAASSDDNPSGVQGICPDGWHVPSDAEWTQLTSYVSSQSEYLCGENTSNIAKALASNTGWNISNTACAIGETQESNNATGFSAVPAGAFYAMFYYTGNETYFWSSSQDGILDTKYRGLTYYSEGVFSGYGEYQVYGFSVRCLRD